MTDESVAIRHPTETLQDSRANDDRDIAVQVMMGPYGVAALLRNGTRMGGTARRFSTSGSFR